VVAAVEEGGVFGLREVEQVSDFEHAVKLGETAAVEKGNGRFAGGERVVH
jgi:hypothetical protein